MKRMYRFICLLITAAMLLSCCGITAFAASKPKLNKTEAVMTVGSTLKLSVSGSSAAVKWNTSDKKVCTVSSKGKVIARSEGIATITAKVGKYKLYCDITVSDSADSSFEPHFGKCSEKTVRAGNTLRFSVKMYGISKVNAHVNNSKVVNIDSIQVSSSAVILKIRGLSEGSTKIVLTDRENTDVKCSITVKVSKSNSSTESSAIIIGGDYDTEDDSAEDIYDSSDYAQAVLEIVNKERTSRGLDALVLDEKLCAAANVRAKEIVTLFDHVRPDGRSIYTVFSENGITYNTAGENIAQGHLNAADVMNGWMNSPGHKSNILNSKFTKLGVGYDPASRSWVQLFAG